MEKFILQEGRYRNMNYKKGIFANTQETADYINTIINSEYKAIVIKIEEIDRYCLSFEPTDIVLKNGEIFTIFDTVVECFADCKRENCPDGDCADERIYYSLFMEEISQAVGYKDWAISKIPKGTELIIIDLKSFIDKDKPNNNLTKEELEFLLT